MGIQRSNLDLFPSVSSTGAIAFCRAGLFKEKSLLSFCPFHSSPNYLFSWELTSFAAVQSVPVSFPSDSMLDVLLSGSAGAAELLCPLWEGHKNRLFIPAGIFSHGWNCFKLCVSVPRLEEDGVKC